MSPYKIIGACLARPAISMTTVGFNSAISWRMMINPWVQFLLSAAIIVYACGRLAKRAAIVAENSGSGTAWAGALMLPLPLLCRN